MVVIRIKNKDIVGLANFLYQIKLKGRDSRLRTRFIRLLQEYKDKTLEPEEVDMIKQYGGIILDEKNIKFPNTEKKEEFMKEHAEWIEEEGFALEVNEANREMIEVVRDALFNYDEYLSEDLADAYDRYCSYFDEV